MSSVGKVINVGLCSQAGNRCSHRFKPQVQATSSEAHHTRVPEDVIAAPYIDPMGECGDE